MTKEPMNGSMEEPILPEMKRRKRNINSAHGADNISYQSLLRLYINECKLKGLSDTTIDGYKYASRYFLDYAGYNLMCSEVTQDLINGYYLHLQQLVKPTTLNSYVFKISPVILWGHEKGYIADKIEFTHVKEQKEIKEIYTEEELKILLKRPDNNDFCDYRAWVIINTLLATGIRAGELRALRIKDVDFDNAVLNLNHTKNRKARIIPIPTSLYNILHEWVQVRNVAPDDYLFCNVFGEELQRTTLQGIVRKYSLKRGIHKYGLHLYRHTFITLSVRKGMSPIMLKRITGHQSMKMLENYYAFNPTDLVNIVDEYNPLEDFKPKTRKYSNYNQGAHPKKKKGGDK